MLTLRDMISFLLSNNEITPSSICSAMEFHYRDMAKNERLSAKADRYNKIADRCFEAKAMFKNIFS